MRCYFLNRTFFRFFNNQISVSNYPAFYNDFELLFSKRSIDIVIAMPRLFLKPLKYLSKIPDFILYFSS